MPSILIFSAKQLMKIKEVTHGYESINPKIY